MATFQSTYFLLPFSFQECRQIAFRHPRDKYSNKRRGCFGTEGGRTGEGEVALKDARVKRSIRCHFFGEGSLEALRKERRAITGEKVCNYAQLRSLGRVRAEKSSSSRKLKGDSLRGIKAASKKKSLAELDDRKGMLNYYSEKDQFEDEENSNGLPRANQWQQWTGEDEMDLEWRENLEESVSTKRRAKSGQKDEDGWILPTNNDRERPEAHLEAETEEERPNARPMVDRVYDLKAKVQALLASEQAATVTPRDIAKLFDFSVDKFQRLAIEAFLGGASVVVCAPTSSGKTLIAEAAAAAVMAKGGRLFYTTPLKALSNQKLRDFREKFGEENVGLLTGDASVNRDAPIVVMTTEILRNMLYYSVRSTEEGSGLSNVAAIVLDEVHYLSDKSRGTVWEETVIYCPKEVQLVCLSATVANPEELADWIAQVHGPTELVTSSRRPVPLMWHFSTKDALLPLLNERNTDINRSLPAHSRLSKVPLIEDTLRELHERDMLPAIWFIFSRRGCDAAVDIASRYCQLLSEEEKEAVEVAVQNLKEVSPEAVRWKAVGSLLRGVAAHHAGCLPAWKSFVEELYLHGLVKVVFATETLAAGINMPARTTVLSSLSKRGDDGHALLSSNAMLQMAGRAGRRGQDQLGHVVVVQSRFEGAKEACKLLFAGPDPLVSQFTATYGMALNLLADTRNLLLSKGVDKEDEEKKGVKENINVPMGRTMDEARRLVECSFGNYLGNEVVVKARKRLQRLEDQAATLESSKEMEEARGFEGRIEESIWEHYLSYKFKMRNEKIKMRALREEVSRRRTALVEPQLAHMAREGSAIVVVTYEDARIGQQREIPALYVDRIPRPFFVTDEDRETEDDDDDSLPSSSDRSSRAVDFQNLTETTLNESDQISEPLLSPFDQPQEASYHVALGADNYWYVFTGAAVNSIHRISEAMASQWPTAKNPPLRERLRLGSRAWAPIGKSVSAAGEWGTIWCADGSMDSWPWSSLLPMLGELGSPIMQESDELMELEENLGEQRKRVSVLRKQMKNTVGYREHQQLIQQQRQRNDKLVYVQSKIGRLRERLNKMQPAGWTEFVQVVNVLRRARAVDMEKRILLPLGQAAAAIRGANELWLALALTDSSLSSLLPAQLAAVCAALVSDGIKVQSETRNRNTYDYEPSQAVIDWYNSSVEKREQLEQLQMVEGVEIPCVMDLQFAGLVEAWSSGLSWKELMADCNMDEGDAARLLRRTIDLLNQIPHLSVVDPSVWQVAKKAAKLMDRPPISELVG